MSLMISTITCQPSKTPRLLRTSSRNGFPMPRESWMRPNLPLKPETEEFRDLILLTRKQKRKSSLKVWILLNNNKWTSKQRSWNLKLSSRNHWTIKVLLLNGRNSLERSKLKWTVWTWTNLDFPSKLSKTRRLAQPPNCRWEMSLIRESHLHKKLQMLRTSSLLGLKEVNRSSTMLSQEWKQETKEWLEPGRVPRKKKTESMKNWWMTSLKPKWNSKKKSCMLSMISRRNSPKTVLLLTGKLLKTRSRETCKPWRNSTQRLFPLREDKLLFKELRLNWTLTSPESQMRCPETPQTQLKLMPLKLRLLTGWLDTRTSLNR